MKSKIIMGREFGEILSNQCKMTKSSIWVISAFVKTNMFVKLNENLNERTIEKKLLIRLRVTDILSGATDLEVCKIAINKGWDVYLNLDMHSKLYVFDNEVCYLGSSNLTLSGTGYAELSNIEMMTKLDVGVIERERVLGLFECSIKLDEEKVARMESELAKFKLRANEGKIEWSKELLEDLKSEEYKFWIEELLESKSPEYITENDKKLLDLANDDRIEKIKEKFIKSKIFRWLDAVIEEEIFFGELTAKLHEDIINNPKVYRREIKEKIANIYGWIEYLKIDKFIVDRPNHSQRIRRVN